MLIRKPLALLILTVVVGTAAAQGKPAEEPPPLQDPDVIVVTATRLGEDPFELPYSTFALSNGLIAEQLQSRTTPEILKQIPGISMQKTAHGQGSPKFRGQTGFQTLLLVDGIRINDSTWRAGNVEYWNHLDPYSFDRFEVLLGPAAALWGSDAVAGVGQAFTMRNTSFEPGLHIGGRALLRFATAEDSVIGHTETHGNIDNFGWHFGVSYKDFGDLEAGSGVGNLPGTGYDELDGDLALTWLLTERDTLSFGAQQNHLDDVPRTHSTVNAVSWRGTTAGSDLLREHDHRRQLYFLEWERTDGGFFDDFRGTLAYKDRYEREDRVRSSGNRQINVLDVKTLGALAQFTTDVGSGTLVWGGDWYHDFVDSGFRELDPGGSVIQSRNRGVVAGDADYDLLGVYAQYTLPVRDDIDITGGLRWTYARLDARDVDVPGDSVVFDNVKDDWNALTASVRAIYRPSEELRVFGGFSQGFRAPNLSDTTRFDIGRSSEQEVPASDLDEETYYTFELGTRYDDEMLAAGITGWVTLARDQISRFRTGNTVNGLPEVSKGNIGDGYYTGFELQGSVALSHLSGDLDEFSLFGTFDYVTGLIDQVNSAGVEVEDRPKAMPPPSGLLGLRWEHPSINRGAEVFARMAYHVNPSRYTEADLNNTQRIPPDGLPGYAALGLRAWSELRENLTASFAIENINDADYRVMDSGLNEPGTNAIFTLVADF